MTTKKTISSTCLPVVPFFVPSTYPSEVLLVGTQLLVSSTKKGKTLRSFTSAYFQKLYKSKHAVSKKKKQKKNMSYSFRAQGDRLRSLCLGPPLVRNIMLLVYMVKQARYCQLKTSLHCSTCVHQGFVILQFVINV